MNTQNLHPTSLQVLWQQLVSKRRWSYTEVKSDRKHYLRCKSKVNQLINAVWDYQSNLIRHCVRVSQDFKQYVHQNVVLCSFSCTRKVVISLNCTGHYNLIDSYYIRQRTKGSQSGHMPARWQTSKYRGQIRQRERGIETKHATREREFRLYIYTPHVIQP